MSLKKDKYINQAIFSKYMDSKKEFNNKIRQINTYFFKRLKEEKFNISDLVKYEFIPVTDEMQNKNYLYNQIREYADRNYDEAKDMRFINLNSPKIKELEIELNKTKDFCEIIGYIQVKDLDFSELEASSPEHLNQVAILYMAISQDKTITPIASLIAPDVYQRLNKEKIINSN